MLQRSISENSLVAMDFSGHRSRIIENPTEALSVAVEEGLAWRVKFLWFIRMVFSVLLGFIFVCLFFNKRALKSHFCFFLIQRRGCLRLNSHGSPIAMSNMGMCDFIPCQRNAITGPFKKGKCFFTDLFFYSYTQISVMVSS